MTEEENVFRDILIDPSLIVAGTKVRNTFESMRDLESENYRFYIPNTFLYLVEHYRMGEYTYRFFLQNALPASPGTMMGYIKSYERFYKPFNLDIGKRANIGCTEKCRELEESLWKLAERKAYRWNVLPLDRYTINILFEEWVFLQTHSVVAARIKKTFNTFIDAGAACLQFSDRIFNKVIARTLKKKDNEAINVQEKLRALAKWFAVGSTSVASLYSDSSIVKLGISLASGYFILFDPDSTLDK